VESPGYDRRELGAEGKNNRKIILPKTFSLITSKMSGMKEREKRPPYRGKRFKKSSRGRGDRKSQLVRGRAPGLSASDRSVPVHPTKKERIKWQDEGGIISD